VSDPRTLNRRLVVGGLGAFSLVGAAAWAQQTPPAGPPQGGAPGAGGPPRVRPAATPPTAAQKAAALPLKSPGIEHMAMIVPDTSVAAKFYSKVFNPGGLHKEKQGDLRYYVTLGDLAGGEKGYIAIGSRPVPPPAFMDHFCTTVENYNAGAVSARLADEKIPAGRVGILADPNGIGLQLLGAPGGLAGSIEPTARIVNGDALVKPHGLESVHLIVNDMEKSLAFYRLFYGKEATREGDKASFRINDTTLYLAKGSPTEPPRFDFFGVKVEPFDRKALEIELRLIGAVIVPDAGDGYFRFRDPYRLGCALKLV
jgi:catechol 2,3-dioxygenase-like lactoylglutathione lyase family enzyme